ncbi:hypothetical protein GCM10011584_33830 [Nocardioides phosphati]|uniref:Zinc ribbon domain-containing protein n=1 Tax=Nocardioides phosphati TaxID=1867775 RepID=A0ABQ2NJF4_9ACTN|nr:hypothetical protein GCM10011584_33830 [Nocardioides phosphati]
MGAGASGSTGAVGRRRNAARRFQCSSARACDGHAWVVTAPQVMPRTSPVRAPWGLIHVKRNGALQTACGLASASWYSFFETAFEPRSREACPACAAQVLREPDRTQRPCCREDGVA